MPGTRRLMILEDDATVCSAIAGLAKRSAEFSTVEQVGSIADARAAMGREKFEVALVDLGLPDGSGVTIIEELMQTQPRPAVVAFTIFDDAPNVLAAIRAGAIGYLLKSTPPGQLIARLLEAVNGQSPFSPAAARHLVTALAPPEATMIAALTAREREVLVCLAQGHSYQTTAAALNIGLGTVQTHVKAIYEKLDISSKAEAAALAVRLRLV